MVKKWPVLKLKFSVFFLSKKNCDLCHIFWSNWGLDTLSPSKWLSAPKFCERYLCSWHKNDHKWSKNGHFWKLNFQFFLPKLRNILVKNGCNMAKHKSSFFSEHTLHSKSVKNPQIFGLSLSAHCPMDWKLLLQAPINVSSHDW